MTSDPKQICKYGVTSRYSLFDDSGHRYIHRALVLKQQQKIIRNYHRNAMGQKHLSQFKKVLKLPRNYMQYIAIKLFFVLGPEN